MEPVIEQAGKAVASDVLKQAAEELTGRSNGKWAIVLLALFFGVAVAALAIKARQGSATATVRRPDGRDGDRIGLPGPFVTLTEVVPGRLTGPTRRGTRPSRRERFRLQCGLVQHYERDNCPWSERRGHKSRVELLTCRPIVTRPWKHGPELRSRSSGDHLCCACLTIGRCNDFEGAASRCAGPGQ